MNVTFFRFQKKLNSTKVPTGGVTYDCILKDRSSAINPTIILKWTGSGTPAGYNMARIGTFNRYYWIDEWIYSDRCWTATMHTDVLATLKPVIAQSSKYVLRSASEFDQEVADSLYPAKLPVSRKLTAISGLDWAANFDGGYFIVGLISDYSRGDVFTAGGANYFCMKAHALQQTMNAAFTGTDSLWTDTTLGGNIGEVFAKYGQKISKSILNPAQFINSIIWVPFTPTLGGQGEVILGRFPAGFYTSVLGDPRKTFRFSSADVRPISITADQGYWRLSEPYTRYKLVMPPFGVFDLPADIVRERNGIISGSVKVDCITGQAVMEIDTMGIEAAAQVGIPIQVAGANVNYAAELQSQINAVASPIKSLLSGDIVGAISGVPSGIISSMEAGAPTATQGSIGGGMAALNAIRYVYTTYHAPVDEDNDEQGKPLCKIKTLGSLSGYIMCADGHLDAELTSGELAEAERYLTGGFFYE